MSNITGAASNQLNVLDLLVLRAAEHSSSVVTIHPSLADVQEGQSLELNCHAPGNPPPRVTWTRASGQLSSNHQVVTQKQMQNRPDSLRNSDISSGVCSTDGQHILFVQNVALISFYMFEQCWLGNSFFFLLFCAGMFALQFASLKVYHVIGGRSWTEVSGLSFCRSGAISCGSCPPPQRTLGIISVGCRATPETQCLTCTSRPSPCLSRRRLRVSLPEKGRILE